MIHEISNGIEENTQKFVQLALCDQFGKKYDQNNKTRIGMTDHYKPFLNDYKIFSSSFNALEGNAVQSKRKRSPQSLHRIQIASYTTWCCSVQ